MNDLDWEEDELSGHLRSGDYWITEFNGRYELTEQDPSHWYGFRSIGSFATEDQAKEVAGKL